MVKKLPASVGDAGSDSGLGRFPWRKKWQLIPVFLPGKSPGQMNLVGYSPWGLKESDMTERLHSNTNDILALQCCVSFYDTAKKNISCVSTYIPSLLDFLHIQVLTVH